MHFSASVTAFLLALPACLAAPTESQPTPEPPVMVSYTIKDGNGDLYYLCAGFGGDPKAVYHKTEKVEPGCVFKGVINQKGYSMESTHVKGTYLGRDGTNGLSLGELGKAASWTSLTYPSDDLIDDLPDNASVYRLVIDLTKEASDPEVKTTYYPNPPDATKGDNQTVTMVTKKSPGRALLSTFLEIHWGSEDPTAANNTKQ